MQTGKKYINRTLAFHEIYQKEILPIFRNYEVYRKRKAKELRYMFALIILASLAVLWLFPILFAIGIYFSIDNNLFIYFTALFPFALQFWGMYKWKDLKGNDVIKGFSLTLKRDCLERVLKVFGDIEWKNGENILTDIELRNSGLFANFNRRDINDEFEGTYNGVNFKICETYLYYYVSGRNRGVIDVFKGVVITFDMNKEIKNRTIVATKNDLTQKNTYLIYLLIVLLSITSVLMDSLSVSSYIISFLYVVSFLFYFLKKQKENNLILDSVKLEDPWFANKFNVYSSDQVEARYLVTPSFMKRFQNLKTGFGTKKAKCSFYGNKIMFAISTNKNLFEIGNIYKSLEDPESINSFYNELSSIYKMIDYFRLDEKTGL